MPKQAKVNDSRLLEPGWGGELAPDEFEFVLNELLTDKKLALLWGFQPSKKRRPEWAVRQVAMFGDPDAVRSVNKALARKRLPGIGELSTKAPEPVVEFGQGRLTLWKTPQ